VCQDNLLKRYLLESLSHEGISWKYERFVQREAAP
jgi:hypothetical protein